MYLLKRIVDFMASILCIFHARFLPLLESGFYGFLKKLSASFKGTLRFVF
jgi:hypothetical protein